MHNNIIGSTGEDIAVKYLIDKGCEVIKRNYRQKFGEIDIVAKSNDKTLLFVEVKTLMENVFHEDLKPEDNLTPSKLLKLKKICHFFAAKYPELINEDRGWRIDLITVLLTNDAKCCDIKYYENIA